MHGTHPHRLLTVLAAIVVMTLAAGCAGNRDMVREERLLPRDPAFEMLDNYGSWIDLPPYGPVWSPWVSEDWRPFSYGHWAWSHYGWLWIGYEPFEWIVYHYGFWDFDHQTGWVWIPGYDWSPANVAWLSEDPYAGWAPLPPSGVFLPQPGDQYWDQLWVFVPVSDFTRDNIGRYRTRGESLRGGSTVRTGTRRPPEVDHIEQSTGKPVREIVVRDEHVRTGGHELLRLAFPLDESERIRAHADEVQRDVLRGADRAKERPAPPGPPPATRDAERTVVPKSDVPQPVQPPARGRKDEEKSEPSRKQEPIRQDPEKQRPVPAPPKAEPPKEGKKPVPAPVPAKPEKKVEKPPPKPEEQKPDKKDLQ